MKFEITFNENPSQGDLDALLEGYEAFTESQIGLENRREIAFFIRNNEGSVVGGVKGGFGNYGWLWIDLLWVCEELRGKGYGAKLMSLIEEEARNNGCTNVYLNSFSFQGVGFYKKIGYREFGKMEDFPPGHSVSSLTKALA